MKVFTFLLEAKQPILATSFQGDPNSDVSYPYIPGSMIRGALISRYIKRHPELPNDFLSEEINKESNQEIKRLFFNSSNRYLNAYLFCEEQEKRTLPVPLAWYQNKDEELFSTEILDLSQNIPETSSLKRINKKFCIVNNSEVIFYQDKRRINIHNLRDRTKGRSSPIKRNSDNNKEIQKGEGAIFTYESLDIGQIFQGIILCEDNDADTIEKLLQPEDIWLGGSQSAGYGHTKIIKIDSYKVDNGKNKEWSEIGIEVKNRINRQKLRVTLLSDAIVRNDCGQISADSLSVKQAIEDKLEHKLKIKIQLPQPTDIFISSNVVGGFNRKWGLPLPQMTALSAGSVFVFDTQLTEEQIKTLENEGIGERCIDGFGRIAINWLGNYENLNIKEIDSYLDINLEEEYYDVAAQIAENILRERLEQCLVKQVSNIKLTGNITNTQLSRLEIAAREGLNTLHDVQSCPYLPICDLLNNLTSKAREQYRNTKISGTQFCLEEKIKIWLEKPIGDSKSWLPNPQELTVNVAGVIREIQPNSDLAREYTLRFIMAVAKKAKKENN
ncbi:CRISPR-associated protein Csx10 [Anabaena sp. FACHB-1237]|uniref:RAMP superfamily CRISPR-associated protein n=1 Tax=Anabaena sp. FACHB-1237 TaxID=2692769 RepID=UPI00167FE442|nr:RAMP superfamily CRISPR-associated protein [Anabaena sp. FACHB-1237]MBD2139032.1 CRISPR-associated protein Csx10 [Anabaena sp. FACHB-1237]